MKSTVVIFLTQLCCSEDWSTLGCTTHHGWLFFGIEEELTFTVQEGNDYSRFRNMKLKGMKF
jgi:hypothetical protein